MNTKNDVTSAKNKERYIKANVQVSLRFPGNVGIKMKYTYEKK